MAKNWNEAQQNEKKFWKNIYLENNSNIYEKVNDENLVSFTNEVLKRHNLSIFNFKEKIITPGDALQCLDDIQCRPEIIEKITKGQKVEMKLTSEDKFLRLFDKNKNFIGIVENCNGFIKPKRLLTID